MKVFPALIVVVSALAVASPADAQWRSERPYRGLFAGGLGETTQLLVANGSLGTGWDDNLVANAFGRSVRLSDVSHEFRGSVSTASGSLSYSVNRSAIAFGATAGSNVRYYPSLSGRFVRREYGSVATSAILGAGFSVHAGAVYQPYNLRSLMPFLFEPRLGDPEAVDEDFPASLEHYFGYSGGAGYRRSLSRRLDFSAAYNYRGRVRSGGVGSFAGHHAGADLNYSLGRNLRLRAGYGYSQAEYGARDRYVENHIIDAGVNYSRALSFSRRTTISFGTGSTAARRSRTEALRFHASGSARLTHEIARTWHAVAAYERGLKFVETWPEPLFADSATAGVGGLLNRRTQVQVSARAMRGHGYFSGEGRRLAAYSGSASLAFGLTRYISSGLTYVYYRHEFAEGLAFVPGFPNHLERQSIRAYISMWFPLYQSARRP